MLTDTLIEQQRILENHTDLPSQAGVLDGTHIDAIHCHETLGRIAETLQQRHQRRHAGAAGTGNGSLFSWFYVDFDVSQHRLHAAGVSKADISKGHPPPQRMEVNSIRCVLNMSGSIENREHLFQGYRGGLKGAVYAVRTCTGPNTPPT